MAQSLLATACATQAGAEQGWRHITGRAVRRAESDFWIDDDPDVVRRVIALLHDYCGTPLCDPCVSTAVNAPLPMVRIAVARLAEKGICEQGLWWCSRCTSKGYVSLIIPGTVAEEATRTASRVPPVPPTPRRRRGRR